MAWDGGFTVADRSKDILVELGLTPVSPRVLDEHKQTMLEKYPGSWAYRSRRQLRGLLAIGSLIGTMGGLLFSFVSVLLTLFPHVPSNTGLIGCSIGLTIACCASAASRYFPSVMLRAPATWESHYCFSPSTLPNSTPDQVMEIVRRITDAAPQVALKWEYGQLVQNEVILDPYLILHQDGHSSIIAIWENDTIHHIAQDVDAKFRRHPG